MSNSPWVLGIGASPHNGAVCLLKGDEIVVAIQEERVTRKKREGIFVSQPCRSVDYCLDYAGIGPRDLSMVVYSVPGRANTRLHDIKLNPALQVELNKIPTARIPHHYSHAIGAFATSGFQEAAILIIDGSGSPFEDLPPDERQSCLGNVEDGFESISLYSAVETFITPVEKHMVPKGGWITPNKEGMLGFGTFGGLYSASAEQIFGDLMEAGKVMGLAPYGKQEFPRGEFYDLVDGRFVFHDTVTKRFRHRDRWPAHETEYQNLASSVQGALEDAILYLVEHLHRQYPSKNLCYAGGVALNSVANERIIAESPFKNVYIMPAAEDSGTAIGAAYHGLWQLTRKNTHRKLVSDAVGRDYSSTDVSNAIEQTIGVRRVESTSIISDTVDLLCKGHIIGWFQGRSELGPRALGQRSILCDPRRPDGKEVLNRRVKHREGFRPFAPVVLLEEAPDWFELEGKDAESLFMLRICKFKEDKKDLVPAVVHIDGTGRFQTVTREVNGPLYDLIKRFYEVTGVPIILNTSFNVMGEPIVETPADALRTFLSTGIDYCVLQDQLVAKTHRVLFEFDDLPWRLRIREALAAAKQMTAGVEAEQNGSRRHMESLPAVHNFSGTFENAGMGQMIVEQNGDQLQVTVNGDARASQSNWSSPLGSAGKNVFEVLDEPFKGYKVVFLPDQTANVDWVAVVPKSVSARDVVFNRIPDDAMNERSLLEKFKGTYECDGKMMHVTLGQDDHLIVTLPGQVGIELLARNDTEFMLRNLFGYGIRFKLDNSGVVTEALVTEPNGTNTLKKKANN